MMPRLLPKGRIPHVCVIGAGMAGLRCADVLLEKGVQVTVIEGRGRIGGRVCQSSHLGHAVDLGPNWIHGTEHNPILDLAKETGTVAFSAEERSSIFDDQGRLMNQEQAAKYSELVWGIISDAFKYSKSKRSEIPPDMSLMDFFKTKVGEKEISKAEKDVILEMAKMWGAFVGDPIERQSLKYFWLEETVEGENLFVASTYSKILEKVATSVLSKAQILLSTKVTSIHSNLHQNAPSTTLQTSTNTSVTFDEVIMTAPLGWLKRNQTAFSPPLPPRLKSAIDNISYGRLEKVYITFPTAFWHSASPPSATPTFPFFSHYLSPHYAPAQNPSHWSIELVSLAALPPSTAHPTLLYYIHGPCATHLVSLITSLSPTSRQYHTILDDFFKPYYSILPHYESSSPACTPTRILATQWQNDELAGYGSYANFQISDADADAVCLDEDIMALREGMPERHVWFAGEHTAPFVALGTTTGAYWSGEAVAKRILGAYGFEGGDAQGLDVEADGKMATGGEKDVGNMNGMAL